MSWKQLEPAKSREALGNKDRYKYCSAVVVLYCRYYRTTRMGSCRRDFRSLYIGKYLGQGDTGQAGYYFGFRHTGCYEARPSRADLRSGG
jgi:hypothetical protein